MTWKLGRNAACRSYYREPLLYGISEVIAIISILKDVEVVGGSYHISLKLSYMPFAEDKWIVGNDS